MTTRKRYLEMVKCRAFGHAWEERGMLPMIAKGYRFYDDLLTCGRCTTERHDRRTTSYPFKLIKRGYDYAINYPGSLSQADALQILIESDAKNEIA